jgi:hypothetical protein
VTKEVTSEELRMFTGVGGTCQPFWLIFDSCASVFDATPLAMGQGSHRSGNPGATSTPEIP